MELTGVRACVNGRAYLFPNLGTLKPRGINSFEFCESRNVHAELLLFTSRLQYNTIFRGFSILLKKDVVLKRI